LAVHGNNLRGIVLQQNSGQREADVIKAKGNFLPGF